MKQKITMKEKSSQIPSVTFHKTKHGISENIPGLLVKKVFIKLFIKTK